MRKTKASVIVDYIKQHPGITQKELVTISKLNRKTVMNAIAKLCTSGVLINKPDTGKIRPGKYYLVEKPAENASEIKTIDAQETTSTQPTPGEKLRNTIFEMVVRCPGFTCRQISEKLGANTTTVWNILRELTNEGIVKSVLTGNANGAIRYYHNFNTKPHTKQQLEETKTTKEMKSEPIKSKVVDEKSNSERKSDFLRNLTSRELMIELRDRGYTGTLYIKREIDIEAL